MSVSKNPYKVWLAAEKGELETIKQLLSTDRSIDIEYRYNNLTPLMRAASKGHSSIVKLLLTKDANVNAIGHFGWSVLQIASEHGHTESVQLLLEAGANIDKVDEEGRTSLHWAAHNWHLDTVRVLLQYGANCNIQDNKGDTALHFAAKYCQLEIVAALLAHKSDNKCKNKDGRTPKDRLMEKDRPYTYNEETARKIITILDDPSQASSVESSITVLGEPKKDQQYQTVIYDINNNIRSGEELSELFEELQHKIEKLSTELDLSQGKLKGLMTYIKELLNMLKTLKSKVHRHTENSRSIKEKVMSLYNETEAGNSRGSMEQEDFNEYVYFRIFNLVSNHVGTVMNKWKDLARILFSGYSKSFVKKVTANINSHHSEDCGRTYELLTVWKMYNSRYDDKIQVLKRALADLKLSNTKLILEDIDYHIKKHIAEKSEEEYPECLTNHGIEALAENVSYNWSIIGENLGLKQRLLEDFKKRSQNSKATCKEMLLEWRNREKGFCDIKFGKLCEALKRANLGHICEMLT